MSKKTLTMEELKDIAIDTSLPLTERVAAAFEVKNKLLNPLNEKDFDPKTYDPESGNIMVQLIPRVREKPPRRLPTSGLKPKQIMQGQRVGNFESKQELYLHIAELSERISDLEDIINKK